MTNGPHEEDPSMAEQFLAGERTLSTSADAGIGKAVVLALAGAGTVVLINHHFGAKEAEGLVREIGAQDGRAAAFEAEVAIRGSDHFAGGACGRGGTPWR